MPGFLCYINKLHWTAVIPGGVFASIRVVMFSAFLLSYIVLLFGRLFAYCKGIQIPESGIHCMESRV